MEDNKKQPPLWIANAVVFALLFAVVCAYFSWQIHLVKNSFRFHANQHADVVSKIVSLNATATIEAEKSIENILKNLLENTARFVAYLDMVEPFTTEELTAFTRESGLAGISLRSIQTPENWLPHDFRLGSKLSGDFIECPPQNNNSYLKHLNNQNLYLLVWSEPDYPGCILIGINDGKIKTITESISLNRVIKAISTVKGIKNIDVKNTNMSKAQDSSKSQDIQISVEVEDSQLTKSIQQLTIDFYLFSFFLIMAGIILSFVLHRYQTNALNRVKEFERELAKERENATLGKSAAAIAHEIRNPLNSLSMGLQRLEIEKGCASDVHIKLVRQMSDAVKRANRSVTGLLNYARPRIPKIKPFILEDLLFDILNLYQRRCAAQKIDVTLDVEYHGEIKSDPELMGQVIENIIKNSVEAQIDGGFLDISINIKSKSDKDSNSYKYPVTLSFKNGNCPIEPENTHKIFEPYFTTRPEGTGLGMAIVRNIVKTLNGEISIKITELREIAITIELPYTPYQQEK